MVNKFMYKYYMRNYQNYKIKIVFECNILDLKKCFSYNTYEINLNN